VPGFSIFKAITKKRNGSMLEIAENFEMFRARCISYRYVNGGLQRTHVCGRIGYEGYRNNCNETECPRISRKPVTEAKKKVEAVVLTGEIGTLGYIKFQTSPLVPEDTVIFNDKTWRRLNQRIGYP
jgi:hypothetical protein